MNTIAIVALLCLFCAPDAWSQKKRSDRELAGLVGPVRIVREYRTFSKRRLKPSEVSKLLEGHPYKTLTYSREGVLLEEDNLYGLRYTYSYSTVGLRVKTANGSISPGSGTPIPPYVAQRDADKYDTSGSMIETVAYLRQDEANPWFRRTYEYDDRGRIRKLSHYGRVSANNLRFSHVVTYTYDGNGDEQETCWRDVAGALMDRLSYSNYKHDRRGNWVERAEAHFQVYDRNQPEQQSGTIYRVITYY